MNIQFKDSDKKLLLLFYAFAIPISLLTGYNDEAGMLRAIIDTSIYIVFSLIALYVIVFKFFPKYFPEKKIITLLLLTTIFLIVFGCLELYLYKINNNWIWKNVTFFSFSLSGLESSLENCGILLGLFLGKKFYDAQLHIQESEKAMKENELRILKSQIDPHFLFNNLNTLDCMIDSDPGQAKIYISRLSKLYRYLIKTKDDEVVHLNEELNFVKDYTYLIQQRYGNAYKFEFEENQDSENLYIPPASMQTLLENVVKHNIGSDKDPIFTKIIVNNNYIKIENNISKKVNTVDSNGTGLSNLISRYKLLSDENISIEEKDTFRVTLPILKTV